MVFPVLVSAAHYRLLLSTWVLQVASEHLALLNAACPAKSMLHATVMLVPEVASKHLVFVLFHLRVASQHPARVVTLLARVEADHSDVSGCV